MFNDYNTFYFIFHIFQIIQQDQIRQVVLYKMKKKYISGTGSFKSKKKKINKKTQNKKQQQQNTVFRKYKKL